MQGFPPAPEMQVTLANWRTRPYSAWAFHHVRELVPTAAIPTAGGPAFQQARSDVTRLTFQDPAGAERRVGDVLAATETDGLVVLRGGRLVAEYYDNGYDGTRPHILFSVSKSVTSLLAGILTERGLLDPDAAVAVLIPEIAPSAYAGATVRHVLDMTVSTTFSEEYLNAQGDYIRYRRATGWNPPANDLEPGDLRSFLATLQPAKTRHGEVYHYVSPNSDLLGWLIERAAGRPYADLLSELIWAPMGAEREADITVDRLGAPRTAGGISATVRDLARLGELVRRGGVARNRQIVPRWWIDDIFSGGDPTAWQKGDLKQLFPEGNYRSKWYQTGATTGAICAIGIHGQWLYIDPESETVIAMVSSQHEPTHDPTDFLTIAMLRAVAASQASAVV